jgi:hypothetical protein
MPNSEQQHADYTKMNALSLLLCQQVWLAAKGPCLCAEQYSAYRFICASLSAFCAAANAAIACTGIRHEESGRWRTQHKMLQGTLL